MDRDGAKLGGDGAQDVQARVGDGEETRLHRDGTEPEERPVRQDAVDGLALTPEDEGLQQIDLRKQDPSGCLCGRIESGVGLIGPAAGEALLGPAARGAAALDVPGANLRPDHDLAVENSGGEPAEPDQKYPDPAVRGRVRRERDDRIPLGHPGPQEGSDTLRDRAVPSARTNPRRGRLSLRQTAVAIGEVGEPTRDALRPDLNGAAIVQDSPANRSNRS